MLPNLLSDAHCGFPLCFGCKFPSTCCCFTNFWTRPLLTANLMATFLIDILSTKCAMTIFLRISREYAFISCEYKMIFCYYLLYHYTAVPAVIDRPVSVQRGWDYLRSLEFRLRAPRPEHDLGDLEVQEAWKKNCEREPNEFNSSIHWQQ